MRARSQRGVALVMSLLLLALALAVISAVTIRATLEAQGVVRLESRTRALNGAEAGLAEAVQRLRSDPWACGFRGELGRATYVVEIEHGTEPAPWRSATVTCTGRSGDQVRTFVARLAILNDPTRPPPLPMHLEHWHATSAR